VVTKLARALLRACLCSWLISCFAGCNRQDADRLARVGRTTATQLSNLAGGPHGKLATGLEAMRGALGHATIDSRVAIRLEWDKDLANLDLRVLTTEPGVVRLEGKIADEKQRRRAVSLAASTLGVRQVVDALKVQEPTRGE
jgi:hypothetical protein